MVRLSRIIIDTKTHNYKSLVALAGGSGFVGTHVQLQLADQFRFRALTRSPNVVEKYGSKTDTEWRQCDIYSLPRLTEALEGCALGIYLVHSMAPSSRLTQGNFADTDLLLADNFIRAAESAGLSHVVYLSGLLPESGEGLSPHLKSREEVEAVLQSRSVKVTVLRAGLIFGPGGSSFSLLVNLVRRLPIMLLPAWVESKTQSVDIDNVCDAFRLCLNEPSLAGGTYDLGGHPPMTYRELIEKTAQLLGRRRRMIYFPFNCFRLSKHWVAFFGQVPPALVGPLQESLCHDLTARPSAMSERLANRWVSIEDSMAKGVDADGRPRPNPRTATQLADKRQIREARRVRSVQRMPLPEGWSAQQVATEYGEWLRRHLRGLVRATKDESGEVRFIAPGGFILLKLTPTPYTLEGTRRCAFYISGALLSRTVEPPGRFEFRLFPEKDCLIASIHGFAPTLPWWLYARTQAVLHLRVMHAFGRYLGQRNPHEAPKPELKGNRPNPS